MHTYLASDTRDPAALCLAVDLLHTVDWQNLTVTGDPGTVKPAFKASGLKRRLGHGSVRLARLEALWSMRQEHKRRDLLGNPRDLKCVSCIQRKPLLMFQWDLEWWTMSLSKVIFVVM